MVYQPFPSSSPSGLVGAVHCHSYPPRNLRNVFPSSVRRTEHPDFILSELHLGVLLAAIVRSVFQTFQRICRTGFPPKMALVHAFSDPATVRGVSEVRRARSVLEGANYPMDAVVLPIYPDMRIPTFILSIGGCHRLFETQGGEVVERKHQQCPPHRNI